MPETTFDISATSQDGTAIGNGVTWPPPASFTATNLIDTWLSYDGELYTHEQGVMRWDTSSLPDDATIDSALLRVYIMDTLDDGFGREYVAAWYNHGGTIGTEDYDDTQPPVENAHAGTALSSITFLQYKDFALSNLSNISQTGFTGLRTSITGGEPGLGIQANVLVADFDHATENAPQLIVTYTEGEPPPPPVTIPQVGVFDPHLNPQAWF